MSTIPSAGCVALDVDGVSVAVHLAPGKTPEDLTAGDMAALEELVDLCRQRRPVGIPRACCVVCNRSVRVSGRGNFAPHLDGVGRNCPGSGLVVA
jgi:hypothetical protein